jgi:hypothetical protein
MSPRWTYPAILLPAVRLGKNASVEKVKTGKITKIQRRPMIKKIAPMVENMTFLWK